MAIYGSQIYGGSAANNDIAIEGTSHETKTTSYVILQPTTGNVGIGTTNPTQMLSVGSGSPFNVTSAGAVTNAGETVNGNIRITAGGNGSGNFPSSSFIIGTGGQSFNFLNTDAAAVEGIIGTWNTVYNTQDAKMVFTGYGGHTSDIAFYTSNDGAVSVEAMRIGAYGGIAVSGTGNSSIAGNVGIGTTDLDGIPAVGQLTVKGTTIDGSTYIFVGRDSAEVNNIDINTNGDVRNTNNSYGAISDAKLKENIKDTAPKLLDLLKIKVRNFNLIGSDLKQIGMIAQELEEIFPGLVKSVPDYEKVPDPDWKPKTLKRQMVETIEVEESKTEIVEIDGKYIQKTIKKIVTKTNQLFDEVPLYNEDGNVLMKVKVAPKSAILDAEGIETEPAIPEVIGPVMHQIPRMEEYTESEEDRPMIVRPTGTVTKSIKYSVFVPILIKAIQELSEKISAGIKEPT